MSEKTFQIYFMPSGITASAKPGDRVSDAAFRAGVQIGRSCGGAGVCGKCRVRPEGDHSFLGEIANTELRLLSPSDISRGVRLACCAEIYGDGEVYVIDALETKGQQILQGISQGAEINWAAARPGYGIAVDIGTTTVACCLINLKKQELTDIFSFLNPQITFGDDVISRIAYSASTPEALGQLQSVIVEKMNDAISALTERNGICKDDILEIVIAGNTVMEHLFLGISPWSIGHSPYKPAFLEHKPVSASSLGLNIHPDGIIKLFPNVAGYVGGDIVSGVEAMNMDKEDPLRLLLDIGTNNEIALGNKDGIFCCAAAAGPALEGARIHHGMRAGSGAIEKVSFSAEKGEIEISVIGGVTPKGLCGSGLVDALAFLLNEGLLEKNGRLAAPETCKDERFKERLGRNDKKIVQFRLTDGDEPIYLTQKDVREVQLALGAIRAGIDVMLERKGITLDDLDEVLLAGAFGNYIDVKSAITVGLLPKVPINKIRSVRNSSGLGACMALASPEFYESAVRTASLMTYVELSFLPDLQKRFVNSMSFP